VIVTKEIYLEVEYFFYQGMTTLIQQRQKCDPGPGMLFILISVTLFYLMTVNNGVVAADYYSNGELNDILYLERLNAMQPQKDCMTKITGKLFRDPWIKEVGTMQSIESFLGYVQLIQKDLEKAREGLILDWRGDFLAVKL